MNGRTPSGEASKAVVIVLEAFPAPPTPQNDDTQ
jgi:hypothetical protein